MSSTKKAAGGLTMAEQADRHELYQASVQNSEFEIDFMDATFEELVGRKAVSMREDFCGTAISSVEWVKRRRGNTAISVDNDPEVLDWGRQKNLAPLSNDQRKRIQLIEADVRTVETEKVVGLVAK